MQKNGWNLFQVKPFAQRLQALTQDATRLAQATSSTPKPNCWPLFISR